MLHSLDYTEGQEFIVINYNQFCKDHNLSIGSISMVINGKYKQYCGWTGFKL
jgi:hypothetical protein